MRDNVYTKQKNGLDVTVMGIFSAKELAEDALRKLHDLDCLSGNEGYNDYDIRRIPVDRINNFTLENTELYPRILCLPKGGK